MGVPGLERRLFSVVIVATWWMTSHSAIVFADQTASGKASIPPRAATISVQQEADATSPPSAAKWQYNGFVDAGYLLDFNHPANHLFRDRSTAFKVDELDLNIAAAGVKKLAAEDSRWGMELDLQTAKASDNVGSSATEPTVHGSQCL